MIVESDTWHMKKIYYLEVVWNVFCFIQLFYLLSYFVEIKTENSLIFLEFVLCFPKFIQSSHLKSGKNIKFFCSTFVVNKKRRRPILELFNVDCLGFHRSFFEFFDESLEIQAEMCVGFFGCYFSLLSKSWAASDNTETNFFTANKEPENHDQRKIFLRFLEIII